MALDLKQMAELTRLVNQAILARKPVGDKAGVYVPILQQVLEHPLFEQLSADVKTWATNEIKIITDGLGAPVPAEIPTYQEIMMQNQG